MYNFFINPQHMHPSRFSRAAKLHFSDKDAETPAGAWDDFWSTPDGNAPMEYVVDDGVAVIPVSGALASAQIPCWFFYADMTYENLTASIQAAISDPGVREIVLRFTSPGGTVLGCAEAASLIDAFDQQKPITAHCLQADSAAYWLASACGRIVVDPTGEVGSIGVIATHVDMSKALEAWGVKVTLIYAGDRKVDGNPYEPLTPEAKAAIQAEIDYLRSQFVGDVAKMRGMSLDKVQATEAACYTGQLGVDAGLADDVEFFHQTLADLAGDSLNPTTQKEPDMAKRTAVTPKNPAAETEAGKKKEKDAPYTEKADDNDDEDMDDDDKKKDDQDDDEEGDGTDAAKPAAPAKGADKSERARIEAITTADEADGREELAKHLAFKTDMSAEDAIEALAAAPKAGKKNPLAEGMKDRKNPQVGAGAPDKEDGATGQNPVLSTLQKLAPSMLKDGGGKTA